jgi:hypothetical protein
MHKFILALVLFSGSAFAFEGYRGFKFGTVITLEQLKSIGLSYPDHQFTTSDGITVSIYESGFDILGKRRVTKFLVDSKDRLVAIEVSLDFSMSEHKKLYEAIKSKYKTEKPLTDENIQHLINNPDSSVTAVFEGGHVLYSLSGDDNHKSILVTYVDKEQAKERIKSAERSKSAKDQI